MMYLNFQKLFLQFTGTVLWSFWHCFFLILSNLIGPKIQGLKQFCVEVQGFKDISRWFLNLKQSNWLRCVIDTAEFFMTPQS